MDRRSFLGFTAPSVIAMLLLILLPLLGTVWLSLHESYVKTELAEVRTTVPLFGGLTREDVRRVPQPVRDAAGNPVKVWNYVGLENYANVLGLDRIAAALRSGQDIVRDIMSVEFWRALEFSLLYIAATTPCVLLLGFTVALAVDRASKRIRGALIFASLLPFIITPVVGALAVYWLFLDGAVVNATLQAIGLGKIYFLSSALSIRTLIILYGVWHVAPFAFVVLYAGLQTLPQDAMEAAQVDGASSWQRLRYVTIPHLAPLFAFVTLIHVMDAYRVFEPVLVFGSNLYATSLQYMTYRILNGEDNYSKAAAASLLTVLGILILLIPMLRRTLREHRAA
jgi:multiple sugar transport system permease protein